MSKSIANLLLPKKFLPWEFFGKMFFLKMKNFPKIGKFLKKNFFGPLCPINFFSKAIPYPRVVTSQFFLISPAVQAAIRQKTNTYSSEIIIKIDSMKKTTNIKLIWAPIDRFLRFLCLYDHIRGCQINSKGYQINLDAFSLFFDLWGTLPQYFNHCAL